MRRRAACALGVLVCVAACGSPLAEDSLTTTSTAGAPESVASTPNLTSRPADDSTLDESPDPIVAAVLEDAAGRTGVPADEIEVVLVESREFSDSSLGCPEPGVLYVQVLTPGTVVVIGVAGVTFEYRVDESGVIHLCLEPETPLERPLPSTTVGAPDS